MSLREGREPADSWSPEAIADAIGPLMSTGDPLLTEGASCDPGTGGGQCLRLRVKTRRQPALAPWGWEAGESERAADRAWWAGVGAKLGGEAAPELDVDALAPRGDGGVLDW